MDQHWSESSPNGPPAGPASISAAGSGPARPQIVQIVTKSGGLKWVVWMMIGVFLFGGAFIVGMVSGVGLFAAASDTSPIFRREYRAGSRGHIDILPVEGEVDGNAAEFVHEAVEDILKRNETDAVVLRVNSPGGEVAASDQIWHEIERLKAAGYPVVASYGGLAASGGYYISCGANRILAEETTVTGSIGVIAHVMTFKGLMDKVGVEPVTIVASHSPAKSVANDLSRNWTDQDRQEVQTLLDADYDIFVNRVKAGRGKAIGGISQVASIADGSVYTSTEAQKIGLIDGIGYLDDAITAAEKLGGFAPGSCEVDMLKRPGSLVGALLAEQQGLNLTSMTTDSLRRAMAEMNTARPMYLMH